MSGPVASSVTGADVTQCNGSGNGGGGTGRVTCTVLTSPVSTHLPRHRCAAACVAGAVIPIPVVSIAPSWLRVPLTVAATVMLVGLILLGVAGARLGGAPPCEPQFECSSAARWRC